MSSVDETVDVFAEALMRHVRDRLQFKLHAVSLGDSVRVTAELIDKGAVGSDQTSLVISQDTLVIAIFTSSSFSVRG